jgi:hypothetical protein
VPERARKVFVQPEKITLMDQGVDLLRQQLLVWDSNRRQNAFYKILFEYDFQGAGNKHASPTKRLIDQKNVITEHKQKLTRYESPEKYQLRYNTGLEKSYIIEPHEGEMDYQLAEEDPLAFFDVLFSQKVTQHKVTHQKENPADVTTSMMIIEAPRSPDKKPAGPLIVKSEVTIRPFLKAMEKLRQKIAERLMKSVDFTCINQLMELLQIPAVVEEIKELVS